MNQGEKFQIGQNIRKIRTEKGQTLSAVAKTIKKTPQWLSNIEKGRRNIKLNDLYELAHFLDVDVKVFFEPIYNTTFNNKTRTTVCGSSEKAVKYFD